MLKARPVIIGFVVLIKGSNEEEDRGLRNKFSVKILK